MANRGEGIRVLGLVVAIACMLAVDGTAQEVTSRHVAGGVWRIDGAVDVIIAQTGEDGLLMVDTGYPFAEAGVRAALREIAGTDRPVRLVNTHTHHGFSNHLYGADAEIVAHENAAGRQRSGYLMAGATVSGLEPVALPTATFRDSMRFRFNGEDISLIHLPGAHTDGDAVVVFHGSNVVATGDVLVPHMPWVSVDEGGNVLDLLASLDRLAEIIPEGARIIPGHDPEMLSRDDLDRFRSMVRTAVDTVRTRMAVGMTLAAIQAAGLPGLERWEGAVPTGLFVESIYRSLVEPRRTPTAPTMAFTNGRWWDGTGFVDRTVYATAGVLTFDPPDDVAETVDLEGGWVVPPLAEAHTHALGNAESLASDGAGLLADGVYYAMVQDPIAELGAAHRAASASVTAPDVAYAQGIVTARWSAMARFYEGWASSGRFGEGETLESLDGRLLFLVDTVEDLEQAWPDIARVNDRFVKVILAYSDEIEARRSDPEAYGMGAGGYAQPGITPDVLDALVERAHGAGLEVSAHIETAADFRVAVQAGVDWIAHMPASWQLGESAGYGAGEVDPYLLAPADVQAARAAGTRVITTLLPWSDDDPRAPVFRRIHEHNLQLLADGGARLMIGSDAGSVVAELLYLRSLGALSDAQLFRLAAVQTPRGIFPEYRLGHLREGWEASFLVLGGDPTEDVASFRDIRLRVKRGAVLQ